MPDPVIRTTRDPQICPACGRNSLCPASPHVYFVTDQLGLRCAGCKHGWPVSRDIPCVPPFPSEPEPPIVVRSSPDRPFAGHPFYA
jgi:hypothetical protein